MGGSNQSTCPPPATQPTGNPIKQKAKRRAAGKPINPIRSHEVTSRGEVDFHDDTASIKCCVDSAAFFDQYNKWRPRMSEDLILAGNDGKGGHASVILVPYVDDKGEMQVAMTVKEASIGQTICDLDMLAHFS